jgi:hypothetical protein
MEKILRENLDDRQIVLSPIQKRNEEQIVLRNKEQKRIQQILTTTNPLPISLGFFGHSQ